MSTKAELEQELAKLRRELSEMQARTHEDQEDKAASSSSAEEHQPDISRVLEDLGIDPAAAKDLGARFLDEISTLQKEKPTVVLLGAFVLGVVLGRMLK